MNASRKKNEKPRATGRLNSVLAAIVFLAAFACPDFSNAADDAQTANQLVEQSLITFDSFLSDESVGAPVRSLLGRAKGVLIYPQVLRGAFIFGVSGGSGTFMAKDTASGVWGGPAFYTIGEASFGLQAGADASQVVLIALTDRGVAALLSTSTKLGANVGVAIGPVGAGATAATQNLSADIVAYSRAKGLYGGVSLEGAIVAPRGSLNEAYYGREVNPTQILIQREVSNEHAKKLIDTVAGAAAKSKAAGK